MGDGTTDSDEVKRPEMFQHDFWVFLPCDVNKIGFKVEGGNFDAGLIYVGTGLTNMCPVAEFVDASESIKLGEATEIGYYSPPACDIATTICNGRFVRVRQYITDINQQFGVTTTVDVGQGFTSVESLFTFPANGPNDNTPPTFTIDPDIKGIIDNDGEIFDLNGIWVGTACSSDAPTDFFTGPINLGEVCNGLDQTFNLNSYNSCFADGVDFVYTENGNDASISDKTLTINATTAGSFTLTAKGPTFLNNSEQCEYDIVVNYTIKDNTTGSETYDGCKDDGYEVTVGTSTFNEATPTGSVTLMAANGCDSVVTINLTFKDNATGSETNDGCKGDGYEVTVGTSTFNETTPTGSVTLTAANGCDSVVTVNLTFKDNATGSETNDGCKGDGYEVTVGTSTFNETTPTGSVTLTAANGCDSVVTVNLTFKDNATGSETNDGCKGDGYEVTVGTSTFNETTPTGSVTLTAANGCDSVVTVNLTFKNNATGSETHDCCKGDGYEVTVGTSTFNETTPTGSVTLTAANGCDSVVTINLTFKDNATGSETNDGCKGDGYEVTVGTSTFNETTPTGSVTLTAANGCDSVVTINLTFKDNATGSETNDGCKGDGYEVTVGTSTFNETTPTGTVTLTAGNGCDSVVTVNLVFKDNTTGTEMYNGCMGYDLQRGNAKWQRNFNSSEWL